MSVAEMHVVHVVPVTQLDEVRGLDGGLVVVDATASAAPLPLLARAVRLRRVLRATGGDLVLAAGAATAQLLRRSGLERSLPHRTDVPTAVDVVRHPNGGRSVRMDDGAIPA